MSDRSTGSHVQHFIFTVETNKLLSYHFTEQQKRTTTVPNTGMVAVKRLMNSWSNILQLVRRTGSAKVLVWVIQSFNLNHLRGMKEQRAARKMSQHHVKSRGCHIS